MTRADRPRKRGIVSAIALACLAVLLGYACVRAALVRALPAETPLLTTLAPHDPDVTIARAVQRLVADRGILTPGTLAAVRAAVQRSPLDARAFLVLGHQKLLDGEAEPAVRTLEAGQRLDPRNRLIHLLLLDRYLRTGRYADAARQFAVSSRLVGPAQAAIAKAMAQMSIAPDTREPVRRTLADDPALERQVLLTLAGSDTPPATIFAIASPAAQADAGNAGSWGRALIVRLVARQQYAAARGVWRSVYGLNAAAVAAPVYDAGFQDLPGAPPFNWTRVASGLGAADLLGGTLSVNYYGRDTGELAGQLLVLAPGAYRFAVTVEGARTGTGPSLAWSLRCANGTKAELMALPAPATGTPHRIAAGFAVPAGCPAQNLVLTGNPGEFPAPVTLTIRDLELRPANRQPGSAAR